MNKVLFTALLFITTGICANADWTIFAYIESSEELQHEAIKNISDMALGSVPENVNIIVQLHTKGKISWIYKIEKNSIILLDIVTIGAHAGENIIKTMSTVVAEYPAKHYGIVLWDHGFGILEPQYDAATNTWNVEQDGQNCFGTCDLIHVDAEPLLDKTIRRTPNITYKALLVNDHEKTVMKNAEMLETFKIISHKLLGGKKLDLCGMDCCLGAMIEHGYQLKEYVNFLVGTQDCELSDGWDYATWMLHFNEGHVEPRQIAQDIVIDYGNYCEPVAPVGKYTQSAIDLNLIDKLTNNINSVVKLLFVCMENDNQFKQIIRDARKACIRFCQMPAYTDIDHFYNNLLSRLEPYELLHKNSTIIDHLKNHMLEGKEIIKKAVVANVAGRANKHAQGISIYFPLYHIDSSYPNALFAQETEWMNFLQAVVKES